MLLLNHLGDVLMMAIIMSVPVSAIVGSYIYKFQKLKISQGDTITKAMPSEERQLLKQLMAQNIELKDRVQNLESIVTQIDRADEYKTLRNE